jgi:hypothetical protein
MTNVIRNEVTCAQKYSLRRSSIPAVISRWLRALIYPLIFTVAFATTYYYRSSKVEVQGSEQPVSVIPAMERSLRAAIQAPGHIIQQVTAATSRPPVPPPAAEVSSPDAAPVDPGFAAVLQGQREEQLRDLSQVVNTSGSKDDRMRAVPGLRDLANTNDEDGRARQLLFALTHDPDPDVAAAAAVAYQDVQSRQGAQK